MIGDVSHAAGAWTWHPHPVVWALLAGPRRVPCWSIGGSRRASSPPPSWPRRRALRFAGAVVLAGVCLGWPLGDLAAHWSLSALVLQRCLLVLAVAPLLLAGLPDDLIRWLTRPAPVDALLVRVLRPPVAVVTVTVLLVGSMAPGVGRRPVPSTVARGALALVCWPPDSSCGCRSWAGSPASPDPGR